MQLLAGRSKKSGLQNRCSVDLVPRESAFLISTRMDRQKFTAAFTLSGEVVVRVRSNYALAVHSPITTTNPYESMENASETFPTGWHTPTLLTSLAIQILVFLFSFHRRNDIALRVCIGALPEPTSLDNLKQIVETVLPAPRIGASKSRQLSLQRFAVSWGTSQCPLHVWPSLGSTRRGGGSRGYRRRVRRRGIRGVLG